MRRLEQLINDVRFNSDNNLKSRYTDIRLLKLFNDAQRSIQNLIHLSDTEGKFYSRDVSIDSVAQQESCDLPEDIFADGAVNSISILLANQSLSNARYKPLRKVTEKERRNQLGYILQNKKFLISPIPVTSVGDGLRINYVYNIPLLSFRVGQISAFTDGTEIQVSGPSLFGSDDISLYSDYISTVDVLGNITKSKILINSYNTTTGTVTTTTPLSGGPEFTGGPVRDGVSVGDYVVIGKVATTHSELPEICEQLLTSLVERKIQAIDASQEISFSDLITKEEKSEIAELFKNVEQDTKYPPVVDGSYLND